MKNLHKILFATIIANSLLLSLCGTVEGAPPASIPWQTLETKYTFIQYQSPDDLKRFSKKVKFSAGAWGFKRLFSSPKSKNPTEDIQGKVDALFERVQSMLDMRKKMKKVKIRIYPDEKDLHEAYLTMYPTSRRAYSKSSLPRAWYIYEFNTIYLNIRDLHEGMLAHELAHCIVDHYLLVRPPRATAEILARYVDGHLFD